MNFKDFPFVKSIMSFIFKPYPNPSSKGEGERSVICLFTGQKPRPNSSAKKKDVLCRLAI
jgi:hypothetical protein